MSAIDPSSVALDPSRLEAALTSIDALWAGSVCADEATTLTADALEAPSSLADLLAHYDYGEASWNGTLNLVAKHLVVAPPTTLRIDDLAELPAVESEFIGHFHHGDVIVSADLGAFESIWITGDLTVAGVIEASYLDAFQDLMVGGNVKCGAIQFMGISMIAGTLEVESLASVHSQGENLILGGVRGPHLVGEHGSTEGWDTSAVKSHIDANSIEMAPLAALLGVEVKPEDKHTFEIVFRALDAARREPS